MRDILHCDLNNFYASVECRDNPSLKGHPVAVCGSVEDRAGIVLAKNDVAKSFGVKTAEAIFEAKRKCPNLIIVPPRMGKYCEISREVRKIYSRYTDLVEPFGMDECWLDVTGSHFLFGTSEEIANRIRKDVKNELGLTVSVGVSFTKILAKLGSDMKKPDAVTVLSKDGYRPKIENLSANELIGIGPATTRKLSKLRIFTLGDLASADPEVLLRNLGKNGMWLWRAVNGYDDAVVHEDGYEPAAKSVGNSTTLREDLFNNDQVWQVMLALSEEVCRRMRKSGQCAGGVCVSIKTKDLDCHEFQSRLENVTSSALVLAENGFKLFLKNFDWHLPVRAVGIRGINLASDEEQRQCSLFADAFRAQKLEALDTVSDSLRERFGKDVIFPARLKNDLFLTRDKIKIFQSSHGFAG